MLRVALPPPAVPPAQPCGTGALPCSSAPLPLPESPPVLPAAGPAAYPTPGVLTDPETWAAECSQATFPRAGAGAGAAGPCTHEWPEPALGRKPIQGLPSSLHWDKPWALGEPQYPPLLGAVWDTGKGGQSCAGSSTVPAMGPPRPCCLRRRRARPCRRQRAISGEWHGAGHEEQLIEEETRQMPLVQSDLLIVESSRCGHCQLTCGDAALPAETQPCPQTGREGQRGGRRDAVTGRRPDGPPAYRRWENSWHQGCSQPGSALRPCTATPCVPAQQCPASLQVFLS